MVLPYDELESIKKQSTSKADYLSELENIATYALDDLEVSVDDTVIKELLRELNIAITGMAEYLVEKERERGLNETKT